MKYLLATLITILFARLVQYGANEFVVNLLGVPQIDYWTCFITLYLIDIHRMIYILKNER